MKSNAASPTAECCYYVYALLDTRVPGPFKYGRHVFKFKPFYVGKGKGNRHDRHIAMANGNGARSESQKSIKIRNILKQTGEVPAVKRIKENLVEQDAFDLERKLVQTIGRLQLKTGPLTNKSDGGEGQKNTVWTEERRQISSSRSKIWWESLSVEYISEHVAKVQRTIAGRTPEQLRIEHAKRSKSHTLRASRETPEQKQARSAAYIASCLERTEEEQQALGKKMASARQAFFDSLSDEEYAKFHKRVARKNRQQWLALTEEQRADIVSNRARGMTSHWAAMSDADRLKFGLAVSKGLAEMSDKAKALRVKRVSASLKRTYATDPTIKQRTSEASAETWANKSKEELEIHRRNCSAGHANRSDADKRLTSKRMSRAGKQRIANMTDEDHERQSAALSKSIKAAWDSVPDEQRSARIIRAQASRDTASIAKKISATISAVHASRTAAESTAIAGRISQTLRNKSPEDRQRLSAGNVMRGLMKRHGIAVHHPVLRPQLDRLISSTVWDGRASTMDQFFTKCERLVIKTKL